MKPRIAISLICLTAMGVVALPQVHAADFGPRASRVRPIQASKSVQAPAEASNRIVRTAGPRQTVPVVREVKAVALLAATDPAGCSERRAGPRATVCL
jgi:hypothetical protein